MSLHFFVGFKNKSKVNLLPGHGMRLVSSSGFNLLLAVLTYVHLSEIVYITKRKSTL